MSEIIKLPDGSLMNENKQLYVYNGEYVNGKAVIPDGVEDIYLLFFSNSVAFVLIK